MWFEPLLLHGFNAGFVNTYAMKLVFFGCALHVPLRDLRTMKKKTKQQELTKYHGTPIC